MTFSFSLQEEEVDPINSTILISAFAFFFAYLIHQIVEAFDHELFKDGDNANNTKIHANNANKDGGVTFIASCDHVVPNYSDNTYH